jgi:hypothetical protein
MSGNVIGGGTMTNWLAIIGLVSLIYWAWRIVAAFQHRIASPQAAKSEAVASSIAPAAGGETAYTGAPPEHVAAIAAAITAMLGAHHIIHLEAVGPGQNWGAEGRWMQQTSHNPG